MDRQRPEETDVAAAETTSAANPIGHFPQRMSKQSKCSRKRSLCESTSGIVLIRVSSVLAPWFGHRLVRLESLTYDRGADDVDQLRSNSPEQ